MPQDRIPRFQPVEPGSWPRQSYFDHYFNAVRCTYSVTANIDVSVLLERCETMGVKFYPAMIYCISAAVNQLPEMRTCFDEHGTLGIWDFMSPCYAVFHRDDKTFSNLWTAYCRDFRVFHERYLADVRGYGDQKGLFPKRDMPGNYFTISSLPWIGFTGFNINVFGDGRYLRPIFTLGQYIQENGLTHVPLAVQAHHAVCDGYHVGQLFRHIEALAGECPLWLS